MPGSPPAIRIALITLDTHLARIADAAADDLARHIPGAALSLHAAAGWESNPGAIAECRAAIAEADIILVTMIFLDDQIRAIKPALEARRENCDALIVTMSAPELVKLTRVGALRMDAPQTGIAGLLKKLRGRGGAKAGSGAGQMAMLRRLPAILRLIPGKAQDLRAYFLTMQYWLAGSEENIINLVRFMVSHCAAGPRAALRVLVQAAPPLSYPDNGLYHPRLRGCIGEDPAALPGRAGAATATVGILLLRSYVLARDTAHYDGVIAALEAQGLRVIPAFAAGLDQRPAIEKYFTRNGRPVVDAIVSLTGFSLVGGPAYNDSVAAAATLSALDVPYIAAQPVEFQTLEAWQASATGLTPVEATIMVAIPELDGATGPIVFGGRSDAVEGGRQMRPDLERATMLAARVSRLVALRRAAAAERRLAIVLFNFPPNAGAAGTAAYLAVFESLHHTLQALRARGYTVDVPADSDALRKILLDGNAAQFGTDANVMARIPAADHVRREPHLEAIERAWGPAPGRLLSNGREIFVLGAQLGNITVALQPGFGYEGDPMRLMFEGGLAPTHAFSAFYRYLREDIAAHAVLHFGTHGALEFMPGKQAGLSAGCWPDRLIGDLPNFYLYAANNPSEGAIAKRRGAATLISYMTPPVAQAGLYKGLLDLQASLTRFATATQEAERAALAETIIAAAEALDLPCNRDDFARDDAAAAARLRAQLYEMEQTLIPEGLHVLGQALGPQARGRVMQAMAETQIAMLDLPETAAATPEFAAAIAALATGAPAERAARASLLPAGAARDTLFAALAEAVRHLDGGAEIPALLHALDGGFIAPAPGGDVLRTPAVLPTGRNIHGFDPFRIPSMLALRDGAAQAAILLDRHAEASGQLPESVAFVLWGTDNLKSEGAPIGQVLALLGAVPRYDSYGRLCGAALIPLAELGRPRIDVVTTVSGIFRDLLPLQTKLLAEASFLAASADEPDALNFVAKHARAHQRELGCDLETAALRVFSNAEGAYGSNVNQLIDSGAWSNEDELADTYESRKCFAYGRTGKPSRQPALLTQALKKIDLAYQNLDSLELGVTTIDHYVDTLGGISRAVRRARGDAVAVYVGDQTQGRNKVRTLSEQVALETRTRTLNPRWYDGMLRHGYEGVRQIEAQVTNTMGWSATTAQVDPWIYKSISETFVLDAEMRARLAALNPKASARMAGRLLEANDRHYWSPDAATLDALRLAHEEIEDRLEGIGTAD